MNMWLAAVFNFYQILFFLMNLACMIVCVLIFCLVTKINIKATSFIMAVFVLSVANFIIFVKAGKRPFTETLYSSLFTFSYASHYISRLQQMVEGDRLDVTSQDWIYGGIINYMDVPYYLIGCLNYFIPLADLMELNEDPLPKETKTTKKAVGKKEK